MNEFSFIIPVYNVEDCLKRCVNSIISQEYDQSKIEIILVDDGSLDNSGKLCDDLSNEYNNVISVHKENGGLSDARNYGLRIASKDYIVFVDSDDYISYDTCKNFNDALVNAGKKCDIVTGGVIKHINGRDEERNMFSMPLEIISGKEFLKNRLVIGKWYVAAWSSIYERNFLINNNLKFWVGKLHEDEDFSPRALLAANTVLSMNKNFYHYIIRENSITTSKNKVKNAKDIFEICRSLDKIYENIEDISLKKMLMTHSAKICFKAIEDGKLYLKENHQFIDMNILRKNCIYKKEKYRFCLL